MASNRLNNLSFTFTIRSAPRSGPTSSDSWNDSMTEMGTDLATLTQEWNNKVVPIIRGLPYGNYDTSIDAYVNGLDGKNCWVDQDASSTDDDTTFFDSTNNRPVTIYEAFTDVYTYVDNQITQVRTDTINAFGGLTTDQKNAIGANIFDSTQVSSSDSLDGKSENNRLNVIQIAADMYGGGYSLDNDGAGNLTNSVRDMVDALLELHNGNWDDDISLTHTGIVVTQSTVNSSAPGDDTFTGSPTNLEEDLDQIRAEIKNLKGTATWRTNLTALYSGGADSLEDLLVSTAGSATKSASNPWGYNYADIDEMSSIVLANLHLFTGQDDVNDGTPTYASTAFVANNDSLELAIGKLDYAVSVQSGYYAGAGGTAAQLAALELFVGQDDNTDSTPSYSGQILTDGVSLEVALHEADNKMVVHSGYLVNLSAYTGQDDWTDTTPTYTSTSYVSQGDPLETAIGKLDAAVASGGGGASDFVTLTDTPSNYTGDAYRIVRVNAGETALEFSIDVMASGEIRSETTIEAGQDVEVTASGYGFVIASPDGTRWRIQVDNSGSVTTTSL